MELTARDLQWELCEYRFVTAHSSQAGLFCGYIWVASQNGLHFSTHTRRKSHSRHCSFMWKALLPCWTQRKKLFALKTARCSVFFSVFANFLGSSGNQPLCGEHSIRLKLCCVAVCAPVLLKPIVSFKAFWGGIHEKRLIKLEKNAQVCRQITSDF